MSETPKLLPLRLLHIFWAAKCKHCGREILLSYVQPHYPSGPVFVPNVALIGPLSVRCECGKRSEITSEDLFPAYREEKEPDDFIERLR